MTGKSYRNISGIKELEALVQKEDAVLVYFSTAECSVCKVLKPKVAALLDECFPKIDRVYIDMNQTPEIAAQNRVFAAPTIIVFFAGKEYIRKSRSFSLNELKSEIERIYLRMFS
ncbi:MAG: hypothetical protein A2W90_12385 [Bacteroidetes bacterium GWF2_42_66]|nr:MAG: hypothetical protein A2W92_23040 [Bacteroidetes bacterium GWA2_42_15]OFY00202.1 MAG: hypothetical protein A2W89_17370 [Bacteroidetes bacterium GWE2_42_39]OFY40169.1 MAG: hypothetical protein A2W90_12385 [Bacteroidetes bacterium GWF2_42_66]HBL73998.1 thioredoxin [Prolixibacteraceae bacterium]HCR91902.1 thioredoxin [Prolixibacteraceae bacterium]